MRRSPTAADWTLFFFFFFLLNLAPRSWWKQHQDPYKMLAVTKSRWSCCQWDNGIMMYLLKSPLSLLNAPHRVIPHQVPLSVMECSLSLMWSTRSAVMVIWRARCWQSSSDDAHPHQVSAQARCFNCHCNGAAFGDGQGHGWWARHHCQW